MPFLALPARCCSGRSPTWTSVASSPGLSTRTSRGRPGSTRRASPRTACPDQPEVWSGACTFAAVTASRSWFDAPMGRSSTSIIDLRPGSATYGNWESFELRDDEQASLYVPTGCAHGFQALTEPADVSYRIDRPHDPSEDVSIAFDDPELAIPWPIPVTFMSKRDKDAPSLSEARASCSHRALSESAPSTTLPLSKCVRRGLPRSPANNITLLIDHELPGAVVFVVGEAVALIVGNVLLDDRPLVRAP